MTSTKDLERIRRIERNVNRHESDKAGVLWTVLCAVFFSAMISIAVISIYHNNFNQHPTTSLCELGVIEWEDQVSFICPHKNGHKIYVATSINYYSLEKMEEFFDMGCRLEKTCPSDLKVMVVE